MPPSSQQRHSDKPKKKSTARRHSLLEFTEAFGTAMVTKCSTCVAKKRVCKVSVRSGRCSECQRRGQACDVRVTQSEFHRLLGEKEKLRKQIKESQEAQDAAVRIQEKALEDLRVARAREERLRKQMDLLDSRAETAVAVEQKNIEELEREESGATMEFPESDGTGLHLSANTWGAFEELPMDFWIDPTEPLPDWPPQIPSTTADSS
jgi:hypothetical protein